MLFRSLDRTVVLCLGEFGRTPKLNPVGGRDHWPDGFSLALAGGGIQGGRVVGETDPEGKKKTDQEKDAVGVKDVYATVLTALGLNPAKRNFGMGRNIPLSDNGEVIAKLLS